MPAKRALGLLTLLTALLTAAFLEAEESPRSTAFVIELHGEIDRSMMVYIRRGIERAVKAEAEAVIIDIDTFGGRVDSALQITSLIGDVKEIPTVAFVTTGEARTGVSWSAGALISLSCDRIYMEPGTSMGAAAPVYQTPEGGTEGASEKEVSAIRAQMAALAEKNGYPKAVALAMVDYDVELVEVTEGEKVRAVTREDVRGEGLQAGRTISPAGKLLTLTAGEMERYGLSSATVDDLGELLDDLGVGEAEVVRVEQTVPDQIVAVLTSAGLTSLLVLAGIIALFIELTSPGFGLPGTTAIICFAAVFVSNFLLGTVGSLELLLFLGGVVLLALEIFLIPGFGVTGVSGILLIVVSLVLSRQTFIIPAIDWQWDIFRANLLIVLASVTASFLLLFLLARYLPRFLPFRRGMVLTSAQRVEEGYTVQVGTDRGTLLGKSGRTLTVLRPVGKAEIGERILTVESEGEYIPAGTTVEVVEVDSNRIVVRSS